MNTSAPGFTPAATAQENYTNAYSWLEKAIRMEGEGKPAGLVSKALDRACAYENAWYSMK